MKNGNRPENVSNEMMWRNNEEKIWNNQMKRGMKWSEKEKMKMKKKKRNEMKKAWRSEEKKRRKMKRKWKQWNMKRKERSIEIYPPVLATQNSVICNEGKGRRRKICEMKKAESEEANTIHMKKAMKSQKERKNMAIW